jgi:hypothetical protein
MAPPSSALVKYDTPVLVGAPRDAKGKGGKDKPARTLAAADLERQHRAAEPAPRLGGHRLGAAELRVRVDGLTSIAAPAAASLRNASRATPDPQARAGVGFRV